MKKAILYEIVNKANGLRYIGVTTMTLKERWNVHVYRIRKHKAPEILQNAFDEYGEESFYINELKNGILPEMLLLEKQLTADTVINGYNTIIGGGDVEERRASAMVFRKKLAKNPEYAADFFKRIGESNRGKIVSESTKLKQSITRKGRKWEQYKKDDRAKQYSGVGNPNAGKYRLYLNTNTGVYYETPDLLKYLDIAYSTLVAYLRNKNSKVSSFVKV